MIKKTPLGWQHNGLMMVMRATCLQWLQDNNYTVIDHGLCSAFVERWHEEKSSFHLLFREMTVTLDDVSCLLHLLIEGMLLAREGSMHKTEAKDMMVHLLGADVVKA